MNIDNVEVIELNFTDEFLEMDFSDVEVSAAFGFKQCCNETCK